jgi:hypothetical protein
MHLLPPAVALVLVGTWLGVQQLSISALQAEIGMLRKHMAAARLVAPAGDAAHAKTAAADTLAQDRGPRDWVKLAGIAAEMQKSAGIGDLRAMVRMQQRLQAMSRDELVAALDELAAAELPAAARALLEPLLVGPLIAQDPALVLARFTDRLGGPDEAMEQQLADALKAWATSDSRKAAAWFDQQIAAGKFDSTALSGKSQQRLQFESALLGVLLTADPAAAAGRLAALPADQRADAIGNAPLSAPTKQNLTTFARLVRSQVPAAEQAGAFARQAGQWAAQGGYGKATEYLDAIKISAEERIACVEQAVATHLFSNNRKLVSADLDSLRAWVTSQAPQVTASVTGKVLCTAALDKDKLTFAEAAELAMQYRKASGNDEVLASFVENWGARSNKEEARDLAAQITDAKRRAEVLKLLE